MKAFEIKNIATIEGENVRAYCHITTEIEAAGLRIIHKVIADTTDYTIEWVDYTVYLNGLKLPETLAINTMENENVNEACFSNISRIWPLLEGMQKALGELNG
jgi:hypothetical protein